MAVVVANDNHNFLVPLAANKHYTELLSGVQEGTAILRGAQPPLPLL
jgi:hypothetical protein